MCKFCDDLTWRQYRIPYRNCMADDNSCDYGSPNVNNGYFCGRTCENCDGCADENLYFSIRTYDNNIGFDFSHRIKELVIEPSSEMVQINFCPWCGKKLSDEIVPFEKCGIEGMVEI